MNRCYIRVTTSTLDGVVCRDTSDLICFSFPDSPELSSIGDTTLCEGEILELAELLTGDLLGSVRYGTSYGIYLDTITSTITAHTTTTYYVIDSILSTGCVDTTSIFVMVLDTSTTVIDSTICQGDMILFNDLMIDAAGIYRDTLENIAECDSFITLTVTVLDTSTTVIDSTICQGDIILFNDLMIDAAGIYRDTLENIAQCDSFIALTVTVLDTFSNLYRRGYMYWG